MGRKTAPAPLVRLNRRILLTLGSIRRAVSRPLRRRVSTALPPPAAGSLMATETTCTATEAAQPSLSLAGDGRPGGSAMPESSPSTDSSILLPPYLRQSKADVQEKFQDLEWLQRSRLLQSWQDPDPKSRWAQEQEPEVRQRNRYMNVQAWANNRIHLRVPETHCDYINASPIALPKLRSAEEKTYIATQGPKKDQLHHFWRMIWHETADPAVIVMLTQMSEAGRDKCGAYFPLWLSDGTMTVRDDGEFGDGFTATVQLLHVEEYALARSTIRQLRLTVGDASKTVWHFLFEAWPDFSVPEGNDCAALLELLKLVAHANSATPDSPPVIHCSAGVGRSGTFIALDYLLDELEVGALDEDDNDDDVGDGDKPGGDASVDAGSDIVFETVNSLREQRMTMVQSDAQLGFIYAVLRQKWLERRQRGRAYGGDVVRPPELSQLPNLGGGGNGDRPGDDDALEGFAGPTQVSDRGPLLPSHV